MLDLLLLTDEIHTPDTSRYNRLAEDVHGALFAALGCRRADAEAVKSKHDVLAYLMKARDASASGAEEVYVPLFPHRPSLALCHLATVARSAGYDVCIMDNVLRYPFRRAQMLRILRDETPRLVGISTTLMLSRSAIEHLVRTVRQASPRSKIVIGGPTVRRDRALQHLGDFAVFGSGEAPMLGILKLLDGEIAPDSIPFIAYRDGDGTLRYTEHALESTARIGQAYRSRVGEAIPVADWSLYARGTANVFALECSRGCKYNCFYCSYDRGKTTRPLDAIREELLRNADLGITKYRLSDSNFTDGPPRDSAYPLQVCRLMADLDLGLEWSCYARVDNMTAELADAMRAAGCFAVFFGVESGDDAILKLMRKGHDSGDARRGIEVARAAGLHAHTNFIVGYPGETEESYRRTMELILETRPDTVTLGQFFVEENAPVRGPRMSAFGLQGSETRWSHATMDSATADHLIAEGHRKLLREGIVLGNEYEFAERMSLGLSFLECKRQFLLTKTLLAPDTAAADREAARAALRELYLERFPAAIAAEQRIMARAA